MGVGEQPNWGQKPANPAQYFLAASASFKDALCQLSQSLINAGVSWGWWMEGFKVQKGTNCNGASSIKAERSPPFPEGHTVSLLVTGAGSPLWSKQQ